MQWWQRNVKKSVLHMYSCCFANLNVCFFDIISHGHCRSDIFNSSLEVFKCMFRIIVAVLSPVNWFRLITDRHGNHIYGFTVCCNPENVLQCDEPISPLYYDHLMLMDAGCTTFSLHMTQWAHNENPSRRKGRPFLRWNLHSVFVFSWLLPTSSPNYPTTPPTRTSRNNSVK